MSTEEIIVYKDKVFVIEETAEREVPIDRYIDGLGVAACHGTLRLPANCIGYRFSQAGNSITVAISLPPKKRTLTQAVGQEAMMVTEDGESRVDIIETKQTGAVLLPHLIFRICFSMHREHLVRYADGIALYATLSTDRLSANTNLYRANLPNINPENSRICFGHAGVAERVRDRELASAVDQVIDSYFSAPGNSDYQWSPPFGSFESWIAESTGSEEAVLAEHDRIYRTTGIRTHLGRLI